MKKKQYLTYDRVRALGNICRYAGRTQRFYSVLEHSLIMEEVLRYAGLPRNFLVGALLHDLEESEFGDILAPVKHVHLRRSYFGCVRLWNAALCMEQDLVPEDTLYEEEVRKADADIGFAEMLSNITPVRDDNMPVFDRYIHGPYCDRILSQKFTDKNQTDTFVVRAEALGLTLY